MPVLKAARNDPEIRSSTRGVQETLTQALIEIETSKKTKSRVKF